MGRKILEKGIMKKAGQMYILDDDNFFNLYFSRTGDDFEIDHLNVALKYVQNWRVAIDGGANYGSWSRYMAKQFEKVLSFEAVDDIYECLEKNVEHHGNIETFNQALGDENKHVTVGHGKRYDNVGCATYNGEGKTPMIPIDSLDLDTLDFLKLDIEGYEYYALLGAKETIMRCKPVIVFEENLRGMLEHNVPDGKCGEFLEELGAKFKTKCNKDYIYGW